MRQKKLTLIVHIRSGAEADLKALLQDIGNDVANSQILRFPDSLSSHFVRFSIFDRDPVPRLLFSSCYSNSLENYIDELVTTMGAGLEQVFSHCEGCAPGTWLSVSEALRFVKQYDVGYQVFVMAFPGITVPEILASRDLRAAIDNVLDLDPVQSTIRSLFPNGLQLPPPPPQRFDFTAPILNFLDRFLVKPMTRNSNTILKTNPELYDMEDRVVQNQMTTVSPNKSGYHRLFLRGVLYAAEINALIFGSLSGLPMVHFAQWSMIDGGANLLFESNFDGTWEKYIDDFIDNSYFGLDAIWGQSPLYPPGGARNIMAFKAGIRNFQYPAQIFYSAYPDSTVQNIYDDIALHRAVTAFAKNESVRRFISGSHTQTVKQK